MSERYFAELHASPASQLPLPPAEAPGNSKSSWARGVLTEHAMKASGAPEPEDTPEMAELRKDGSREGRLALAKALDWQLRYGEAVPVYTSLIEEDPEDASLIRIRAARYLTTLRCGPAAADFLRCRELGLEDPGTVYRTGLARYLAEDYAEAMKELELCFRSTGDELGVSAVYWHTLAALRSGEEPSLLKSSYREGMDIGHHTAYDRVCALAAGFLSEDEFTELLAPEESDLDYPILAYGLAVILEARGKKEESRALLGEIIKRDGFWIAYGYIAAWNDLYRSSPAPSEGDAE